MRARCPRPACACRRAPACKPPPRAPRTARGGVGQCSALGPAHSAITTLPPGASVIHKTLRKRTSAPTPSGASKQPGPNSNGSKGPAISVNWPAAAGCPGVGAGSGTGAGAGAGAGDGTGVAGLLPSPPQAQAASAVAKNSMVKRGNGRWGRLMSCISRSGRSRVVLTRSAPMPSRSNPGSSRRHPRIRTK